LGTKEMAVWFRRGYVALLALAAPVALWTSFEMYGLTLRGSQMLFYSISHAYPVIYTVVFLSLAFFGLLALFNIAILLSGRLRQALNISIGVPALLLALQATHVGLLVSYSGWATSSYRVLVCFLALALLLMTSVRTVMSLAPSE
jgi:hypothetical protein